MLALARATASKNRPGIPTTAERSQLPRRPVPRRQLQVLELEAVLEHEDPQQPLPRMIGMELQRLPDRPDAPAPPRRLFPVHVDHDRPRAAREFVDIDLQVPAVLRRLGPLAD